MASVALATGEWCWLHASDDLIADGALRAVLAATTAAPADVVGVTVGRATFDAAMLCEREVEPAALLPSDPERARSFADPFEAIAELGLLFTYLPSQVVRRAAWEATIATDPRRPLAASAYYPHVYMLVRLLLETGARWSWVPDKLVMNRPRHDVSVLGGSVLAAALGQPADLVRTWSAALGPATPGARLRRRRPLRGPAAALHRALLARAAGIWAVPLQLDALKARPGHTLTDDGRMLWALVRVFWSLPVFWRTALPRLLVPHRLVGARRRQPAMPALAPAELTISVVAALPTAAVTARNLVLDCEVVNETTETLRSTGPHPVHIGARWRDERGEVVRQLDRALLPAALAPGARCRVTLTTPTPWTPGRFVLDVSAVQEGVAWCIDAEPGRGVRASVDVQTRAAQQSGA